LAARRHNGCATAQALCAGGQWCVLGTMTLCLPGAIDATINLDEMVLGLMAAKAISSAVEDHLHCVGSAQVQD
jgi:hypothetical protein